VLIPRNGEAKLPEGPSSARNAAAAATGLGGRRTKRLCCRHTRCHRHASHYSTAPNRPRSAREGVGWTLAGAFSRDDGSAYPEIRSASHTVRESRRCAAGLSYTGCLHCLERTFTINSTPPIGVQFSHPVAAEARSGAVVSHMAHEGLFREPEFAPGPFLPEIDEPAPFQRQYDVTARPRRTTRRPAAA
jgi:hypothetical protein